MQFYPTLYILLSLTLGKRLSLAQDTQENDNTESICKGAPLGSLRCCSTASYMICSSSNNTTCHPNPFAGVCVDDRLAIHIPNNKAAIQSLSTLGIKPSHLTNPASYLNPTATAGGVFRRNPMPKHHKTTSGANKKGVTPAPQAAVLASILGKKPVKNQLGLSPEVATATDVPPMSCQVIGNVVLDRCDYDNALFDHWMGDEPCDYGYNDWSCPSPAAMPTSTSLYVFGG